MKKYLILAFMFNFASSQIGFGLDFMGKHKMTNITMDDVDFGSNFRASKLFRNSFVGINTVFMDYTPPLGRRYKVSCSGLERAWLVEKIISGNTGNFIPEPDFWGNFDF